MFGSGRKGEGFGRKGGERGRKKNKKNEAGGVGAGNWAKKELGRNGLVVGEGTFSIRWNGKTLCLPELSQPLESTGHVCYLLGI
jgi:hypothetical protein